MRLAVPDGLDNLYELVSAPQSAAQPVGWRTLLELGPIDVTISTKWLTRCPHCQQTGVSLPLGVEVAIIGMSSLLTDTQLREFSAECPRAEISAEESGKESYEAW